MSMPQTSFLLHKAPALRGSLPVPSAKNSVLPLLAAALLCDTPVRLRHVPALADVTAACGILSELGRPALWQGSDLILEAKPLQTSVLPACWMERMRSGVFFLAPVLARTGRVEFCAPGGCNLGARPVDIHLEGLCRMGAVCEQKENCMVLRAPHGLHGCNFALRLPSVGATETMLMAAAAAEGVTRLDNAAVEPEVLDLTRFYQCLRRLCTAAARPALCDPRDRRFARRRFYAHSRPDLVCHGSLCRCRLHRRGGAYRHRPGIPVRSAAAAAACRLPGGNADGFHLSELYRPPAGAGYGANCAVSRFCHRYGSAACRSTAAGAGVYHDLRYGVHAPVCLCAGVFRAGGAGLSAGELPDGRYIAGGSCSRAACGAAAGTGSARRCCTGACGIAGRRRKPSARGGVYPPRLCGSARCAGSTGGTDPRMVIKTGRYLPKEKPFGEEITIRKKAGGSRCGSTGTAAAIQERGWQHGTDKTLAPEGKQPQGL